MINQEKIHSQCFCYLSKKRIKALKELEDNFSLLPNKQQAWNDIIKLTTDKNSDVRYWAASSLGSVFSDVPDKQQAWNDLIRLTNDKDHNVRYSATNALGSVLSQVPDKQYVWNDLLRLIHNKDGYVSACAAKALGFVFSQVPDKQQAWNDLLILMKYKDSDVRYKAAKLLSSVFSQVPDKQQAWNDLLRLTNEEDFFVRYGISSAIGSSFSQMPDKQQAWNDLHRLTNDENRYVRSWVAFACRSAFSHLPDNQQVWNDLHRLTNDKDSEVRSNAAEVLCSVSFDVLDKQQVWNDLLRLTNNEDSSVRCYAVCALDSVFSQVADKQQAWYDLFRLTNDEDSDVNNYAVSALGNTFNQVPDKQLAWNDLHRLINDEDILVKSSAAEALGYSFSQVPDEQQAWSDLHRLTNDENSDIRTSSNHSLGKISIFIASQAETDEDYKKEFEKAIDFFEIAAKEASYFNPAQFCLPFYRSFHTIVFKGQESKEVEKYLAEAKAAIEGSKNKELLFEAVENLANALKEVQNLKNLDLEAMKGELNFYRKYCDRAAELMRYTEKTAPFATIVMRKGLPILDRNLKELLEEIQKKARIACKESKGTDTEEIAYTINREIQRWEIGRQEEMAFNLENLIFTLEANTPLNFQSNFILDRIKQIPEQKDVAKQYGMLSSIFTLIIKSSLEQNLQEIGEKVNQIGEKLEEITISLKPGISEELIIHIGPITQWGGIEYTVTMPLQDISYPELKEDLKKIVGKKIDKLSKMPAGLANKVRDYLIQKKMWSILDKLT